MPSLQTLVTLGVQGFANGAGPISPHTYWWNGTEFRQLTQLPGDGSVQVHVDGEFGEVLNRLG